MATSTPAAANNTKASDFASRDGARRNTRSHSHAKNGSPHALTKLKWPSSRAGKNGAEQKNTPATIDAPRVARDVPREQIRAEAGERQRPEQHEIERGDFRDAAEHGRADPGVQRGVRVLNEIDAAGMEEEVVRQKSTSLDASA